MNIFAVLENEPLAWFSSCRRFRYVLWRRWNPGPALMWILLNPSTADDKDLDPTLRRCLRFSQDLGYGAMCITNLFPYRATDPKEMKRFYEINWYEKFVQESGWENIHAISRCSEKCDAVIAGWGKHGGLMRRNDTVAEMIEAKRGLLNCLDVCGDGNPKHPLYLRADLKPRAWSRLELQK